MPETNNGICQLYTTIKKKKKKTTTISEDVEILEPLCTVDGSVK